MGMVDLMREKDQGSSSSSSLSCDQDMDVSENNKKCCVDCKTTKTPLWRGGPAGPKSLCNACGIRYRKRRASLGLNKGPEKKKEKSSQSEPQSQPDNVTETIATTNKIDNVTETIATTNKIDSNDQDGVNGSTTATDGGGGFSESLKMNLMTLGKDLMLQRPSPAAPTVKKQRCRRRRELGEEEQAAVCLLAMSCGYVFG